MLKDITLGQFFPADTPVHRLDPRTKLLCVILYIVALFSAKSVLTYGIMIAVLTVSVLVSKVPFKSLTKGLKPVYFVVAFTAIMNMFFTAGTPVADVWLLRSITWEGIIAAVQMVLRIILLIMGTFLMTYTTSPIALTDAMENLLGPLKKLKLPVHELATAMECRCYHGGEGRTALRVLRYRAADYAVLAGFVVLTAGIIVLKKFGL